ncbi:MAG TPA: hypothetical protein VHN39_05290, partial [Phenylobacterium sp.]|nr:hypothetical protein [Phenylobacterium sp.]
RQGNPTGLGGGPFELAGHDEAGRVTLAFHETRLGRYVAHPGDRVGAWDLTAKATDRKGERFTADRRLSWP